MENDFHNFESKHPSRIKNLIGNTFERLEVLSFDSVKTTEPIGCVDVNVEMKL